MASDQFAQGDHALREGVSGNRDPLANFLKILDNFLQKLNSERCKSVKILQILKNAAK